MKSANFCWIVPKGVCQKMKTRAVRNSAGATPSHAEELALYEGLAKAGENFHQAQSPGELGWARLSRAIETERQNEIKSQYVGQTTQPLWRYATFALGFVVIAQAAMWFSASNVSSEPTYVTVTEAVDSFDAQVIFNPDATEIDIRELLHSVNGEIVMGPSALGIYTVRFVDEDARSASLDTLKAATKIIESASPK